MATDVGVAEVQQDKLKPSLCRDDLLRLPCLPPPRLRIRPWWFPVQELDDPLVFYVEAWLADAIFGKDRAVIPEMEWMSQVLLSVDTLDAGSLAEITIYGRPRVQNRVKSILLSQASWLREYRAGRAEKMKQLEEFLKTRSSGTDAPPATSSLYKTSIWC
ncbi:oocyte-expressed protein homolog [Ochotona curzoniae]|uniref:oocyte-expressed protein homolog n=1 Tax=Ochotona curzoniae TaxID=130825 RepID=UPI001B34F25E|nr:oocyte-expressed protein homolog [Ochotona curzoniae]